MSKADLVQQILDELWRSFKQAGRGSITRIESQLQVSHNYFKNWKSRRVRIDLVRLEETLEILDIEPLSFFERALTPPATSLIQKQKQPRFLYESPSSSLLAEIRTLAEKNQLSWKLKEDDQWLKDLEKVRLDSPLDLVERAPRLIVHLGRDPRVYARFLGIYGSALRAIARMKESEEAINEGLRYAAIAADLVLRAELLQRRAILEAERGNYAEAFTCAHEAVTLHALEQNKTGIGKSMLDVAGWYYHQGAYSHSIKALGTALKNLPEEEFDNRFGAILGLGYNHKALGNYEDARAALQQAMPLTNRVGYTVYASLEWLDAELSLAQQDFSSAESTFRKLMSKYSDLGMSLDAATALVELVNVLVRANRVEEVLELARASIWLLAPLKEHKIAQAAVTQLVNWGWASERVTLQRCAFLRSEIKRQRADNKASARFATTH